MKFRRLAVIAVGLAFAVGGLSACVTEPPAGPPENPAAQWVVGTWSGILIQPGVPDVPMYLELDNGPAGIDGLAVLDGTVNYPSYPCSGTLTQASVSDSEFVATETITSGPGCLSGTWTFTKVSDTTILGSWVGEGYSATTTLYKQT